METIKIDTRLVELIQRCEVMVQLTTRATSYWNIIKMIFQMPLILTSSIMCILNSFDEGNGKMKIPNVIVNGVSVLLISYQSNLKVAEKVELYKNLSNEFLQLAHQIEGLDHETIDRNMINNLIEKYDRLIVSCNFEDIPKKYKLEVIKNNPNKKMPLQLNGCSGLRPNSTNMNFDIVSEIV